MSVSTVKNSMDAGTVVTAALVVSAIGALFYNVLPLYLGTAQDYRGLDNRSLGFLSAAFFLGYNLVTMSAFFWIRSISWSKVVALSVPLAAASLVASTMLEGYAVLLVLTVVAGGAFSSLYGIGTTILGDTSEPARWYGIKIATEALLGALLLLILPATAIAKWGFNGIVIGLVLTMIFLSPLLFWIPARSCAATGESSAASPESRHGNQGHFIWLTLLATLIFFSGASAMWAFVERIGNHAGFDTSSIGTLLSVTLVFAVIGSLLAAAIGGRFGNVRPFVVSSAIYVVSLVPLIEISSFLFFAAGICLLTFSIGLALPFAVTEIARLDVDGRYVVLSVPAIGLGAMIGPAAAGLLAAGGNFFPVVAFGGACTITSAALILVASQLARASTETSLVRN